MTKKHDQSVSKKKKYLLLALFSVPMLCTFCYFQASTSGERYYKNLDKRSPHPTEINIPKPEMITNELSDHTYNFFWIDENSVLTVDSSNVADIEANVSTREFIRKSFVVRDYEDDYYYRFYFEPNDVFEILATCPSENLTVRGKYTQARKFEVTLLKGNEVISSFTFSSRIWEDVSSSPFYRSGFSPKCQYFYLVLYGDIGPEALVAEEFWLLNVHEKSFSLALTGRQYPYALFDAPVQDVAPSWSPDGEEFIFGDGEFGLEIYNVKSKERRFVAGPSLNLYYPKWSPSGEWIAVKQLNDHRENTLAIISPNGKEVAFVSDCLYFSDFEWSPNGKQLAYICHEDKNSLWLWKIEK